MTRQKQGLEDLRLQVEVPVTGLPNLIKNPSGDLGTWGWVTPVANTVLTVDPDTVTGGLEFETTVSQACYWTSEYLPANVGDYYSARFDIRAWTASHTVRVRFEWYDVDKSLLSSSTQSSGLGGAIDTYYYGAVVAPASTAYVKLRFDFYNGTGTTNPSAGAVIRVRDVMVTETDSATVLSVRTNLIPNPTAEGTSANWGAWNGSTFVDVYGFGGAYSGSDPLITYLTDSGSSHAHVYAGGASGITVSPNTTYTFSVYTKAHATARNVRLGYQALNGSTVLGTYWNTSTTNAVGSYTRHSFTFTTGTVTNRIQPFVRINNPDVFEFHFIDAALLEASDTLGDYFDGSLTDTSEFTYAWTGTAQNSSSTETTATDTFEFVEPYDWQNILGPTYEIKINRGALDVGLLSASIRDDLLDPAQTESILKPGKLIRLQADVDGVWEHVYEGVITNAVTTYEKEKVVNSAIQTKIVLSAADHIRALANQGEERGVATIDDLPGILEGKGVPWNVNGSGDQVISITQVSKNVNASTLDQIAIARDSALGYAWVDRRDVLNVFDAAELSTIPVVTFSDAAPEDDTWLSYSDIDVNFNTESCINFLTVKWLRYDTASGNTEEIPYGPYQDASSIATWGAHTAEFVIGGATESEATIDAYGAAILAANGTPEIRCNRLRMPVRNDNERKWAALLDLYSPVAVKYDTVLDTELRITSLEHTITAEKWTVDYSFDVQGSVAAPTVTPSPNGTFQTQTPYTDRYRGSNTTISNTTWTVVAFGTAVEEAGISQSAGVYTVERPGRYMITARIAWDTNSTGRRHIAVYNGSTNVAQNVVNSANTTNLTTAITYIGRYSEGDTFEIRVWQNSGGNLAVVGGRELCNIQITWIGP